LSQPTKVIIHT